MYNVRFNVGCKNVGWTKNNFFIGLDIDGLYRVSGNLAVIQKLRFAVNHGKYLYIKFICN